MLPHGFITGSVYHVLFRAMASEQDNLDKCRYLFFRSISLVAVYATPLYVGLLWLAEPLIRGVYGEKWVGATGPLMILAFAWPFWLMDNLSGAVLAAQNRLGYELKVQIATLLITVLAVVIALPYGIDGVAWAISWNCCIQRSLHALAGLEMPQGQMAGWPAGADSGHPVECRTHACYTLFNNRCRLNGAPMIWCTSRSWERQVV